MTRVFTCVTIVALSAGIARAGSHDFVIEHAGVGGTSQQAAPYIQKFLEHIEGALGWPKGSANGDFFPEPDADFKKFLADKKPGIGLIDPDQFLELQKLEGLSIIGTVFGKNQSLGHLNLVTTDAAIKGPADLKGKIIASTHLQEPKFLTRIVFDGKFDAKDFTLQKTVSMLKAVKAVSGGKADAALLSDEEVEWLKSPSSPYPTVKVVWTSPALPPMPVVAFNKNSTPAERDAFAKMLLGMCSDPKGAEVCKALDIQKFGPPDKTAYDAAMKKYSKIAK